jgi:hypothetical protein
LSARFLLLPAAILTLSGCRQDMHDQPRYKPLGAATFFADGRASRPVVEGTVARGRLRTDRRFFQGREGGEFIGTMPVPVTMDLLRRGRERYNIYCSPCHGLTGSGEGMVVQRGFRHPPTFHSDRVRQLPVGHYFDAITNGFGAMASYASRVPVRDRWAIIAYIRALQLSQNATIEEVPPAERGALDQPAEAPKPQEPHR